ncbi:MAG: hypothetical protein ACI977_000483 [Candidatus Nanohaloarchaea archaeon]|jgi:uncharacterized membrane protein required for colicin V production
MIYSVPLSFTLAFLGTAAAFLSAMMYVKLRAESEKAMVSFQLKPSQTIMDFRAIYLASFCELASFTAYFFGAMIQHSGVMNVGRSLSAVFALVTLTVMYRWWRRF